MNPPPPDSPDPTPPEFDVTLPDLGAFDETLASPDQLLGGIEKNLAQLGNDLQSDLQDSCSFPRYEDPLFLDEGGMGKVYQAIDPRIERTVAIKSLQSRLSADPSAESRFLREAQLNSQLTHPNIVPIYDLSHTPDRSPFFVMKLLEGRTLADAIEEHKRSCIQADHPPDGTPLLLDFIKVCEAISFAHANNILHRDLKPANIMLGSHGEVWVMDWGLAKDLRSTPTAQPTSTKNRSSQAIPPTPKSSKTFTRSDLTVSGAVVGTPAFMSPEQARGAPEVLDVRSDVHSLGAILYNILTLSLPYPSDTVRGVLTKVRLGKIERPRKRNPEAQIPRDLEAITLKAMAFRQEKRYRDANALRKDLIAFLERRPVSASTYSALEMARFWIRKHKAACLTFLVASLTSLFVLSGISSQRQKEVAAHFTTSVNSAREMTRWDASFEPFLSPPRRIDPRTGLASFESTETHEGRILELRNHLAAASLLDQVLPLFPEHTEARTLRTKIGRRVIQMSLAGEGPMLARFEFERLRSQGIEELDIEAWEKKIAASTQNSELWYRKRIGNILSDLNEGLSRPNRPLGAPGFEDYLDEVASYPTPQVKNQLIKAFSPLLEQARTQKSQRTWSAGQKDQVRWMCQVLGSFSDPEVVQVLTKWSEVLRHEPLLVEVGIALCRTRQQEAFEPLLTIRKRLRFHPTSWSRISRWMTRIPLPPRKHTSANSQDDHTLAALLYEQGDATGSLSLCDAILRRDPENILTRLLRAQSLSLLGRNQEALETYNEILTKNPDDTEGLWRRTDLHLKLHNFPEALKDAQRAIQIDPKNHSFQYSLGLIYLNMKKNRLAQNHFSNAIQISPHDPEYFVKRGTVLRDSGKVKDSFNDFNKALELDPENANAYSQRALAHEALRQFDKALADHTRALRLAPDDANYHSNRGNMHFAQKHFDAAWADYTRAIELDPHLYQPFYNRGMISYSRKDFQKAIADYNRAIEIHPDHAKALTNRGLCFRNLGQTERALADYTRAIQTDPRLPNPYSNRALIYLERSRPREALADLDRYLKLAPRSSYVPRARYHRGRAHRALNNHPQAVEDFRYYLQKFPQAAEREMIESYLQAQQNR